MTDSAFEVFDITNEEFCLSMGIFTTLEKALELLDQPPDTWPTFDYLDDIAVAVIHRRELDQAGNYGEAVLTRHFDKIYDEETDTYKWQEAL
jgi:hypothetical protein